MSRLDEISPQLEALLAAACREDAAADELRALEQAAADPASMRLLVDYLQLNTDLQWLIYRQSNAERCLAMLGIEPARDPFSRREEDLKTIDPPLAVPSLSPLPSPLSPSFVGGPVFSYIVATVVLCLMLLGGWAYKVSHVSPSMPGLAKREETPAPIFVGRVTGMKDCRWADHNTQTYVGSSVSLDRRYALASGLLEITHESGAKVILEGPCKYKVESSAGGFLELGKLTANISGQRSEIRGRRSDLGNQKSPNPQSLTPNPFVIKTPTAKITDLGTEFGVEVNENGDTVSHVFQGYVTVEAVAGGAGSASGTRARQNRIVLRQNESARVLKDAAEPRLILADAVGSVPVFVRKMPGSMKKLDPAWHIDGDIFIDDFDGDSIDSNKWDVVVEDERSLPGGGVSLADGCAVFCTHDKEDREILESNPGIISDTPGKRKIAYLLSKSGQLDFSDSPNDWWAEIRFQFTGNLDSPNWSPEWRTWAILSGEVDGYIMSAFDLRAIQRGSVNSDEFGLGWFGCDNSGDIGSYPPGAGKRMAQKLRVGLKKGRFYTIAIHRKSDAKVDIYLDGELIATRPMIGDGNPAYLRTGDMMPWNISGTCKIDYVKVGTLAHGAREGLPMQQ
ncbi:MAG: hypothetical protein JW959_01465 [Pirellulales bacterium]|nr:hypothetical protein [Pirellulales bacterium]